MELKNLILKRGSIYDLIFHGKNKDYGAYYNRKVYPEHIKKSMLLLILFFLTLYTSIWIYNQYFAIHQVFVKDKDPVILKFDIQLPTKKQEQAALPPPPLKKIEPTIANAEPIIVDEITAPTQIEPIKNVIESTKNIGGSNVESNNPTTPNIGFTNSAPESPSGTGIKSSEPKIVDFAEVMPEFPGGETALISYLSSMIHYPNYARLNEIEGTVNVEFVVMADGSIGLVKLLTGIEQGCNDEALRVIKKMPKWKPGTQGGEPVNVIYTIPITFKLSP